jgi:DNA-binding NarL/FixJ family response regulator
MMLFMRGHNSLPRLRSIHHRTLFCWTSNSRTRSWIKVLVVSALASPLAIRQILDVGVAGFVSKSESTEVLLEALAVVASGGWWTSPQIAIAIFSDVRCPQLSHQEQRALTLYASGLKLDAVARSMEISAHSAKTYIDRVRAKYAAVGRPVTGKIDLYREAHRDGYLPD